MSGLVALKECLEAGIDAVVYEGRSEIGGQWAYQPDPEKATSSIYQGTILNSCRDSTSFSDFPLDPARYPDYFGHRPMLQYLQEYAQHFNLHKHIRLSTRILDAEQLPEGTWKLRISQDGDEEAVVADSLLCCTGHDSKPRIPDFPGRSDYQGEFLHSHYYRSPAPFEGKRVAIIGFGSSAVDIACEVAPQASELRVVARRGAWVLPRYVLGKPLEAWDNRATQVTLPQSLAQWLQTKLLETVEGKAPKEMRPDHKVLEQSPTVRGDFIEKVRTGVIKVTKASIDQVTPTGLALSNGETFDFDVIICCTGYDQLTIPFLPPNAIRDKDTPENSVNLYKFLINPDIDHLYFLGFMELFGPLMPTVEAQARHVAALITGRIPKASHETMLKDIDRQRTFQAKHFLPTERHTLIAFPIPYIDDLLAPLDANPTFGRLLGRVFSSGHPWKALGVLNAVYFAITSSAQWRLFGRGAKYDLASETVLRVAGGAETLSAAEVKELGLEERF